MRSVLKSILVFSFVTLSFYTKVSSQTSTLKVAVFAPVYLDSAFDGNNYKLGNNSLPKTILPGLDFYNGVSMAIDSLQSSGINAEVLFYDLKSNTAPLASVLQSEEMSSVSLIIASVNNNNDAKLLAGFASMKRVPLISSTFPNNGSISNNEYFIAINPALRTHCEEIYRFLQRNYSTGNILFFTRKGAVENWIQSTFSEIAKATPSVPLKIKTVELSDTFSIKQLATYLDSTKKNVLVCGSLNETFGVKMIKALSNISSTYTATIIGMPNWDGLKELDKPGCKGVDIIYSSPYNFNRQDKNVISITNKYKSVFNGRPSDMFFKGYESMFHFTHLLTEHSNTSIIYFLSEKKFKLFNDFDIRPTLNKTNKQRIDFFENRKLYFIKKNDGQIKTVF